MRDMVCRSMMPMLHRRSMVELPVVRRVQRNWLVERKQIASVNAEQTVPQTSFAELGAVELRPVRRSPGAAVFNSLVHQHYYLGYAQPVGDHLKYLVYAGGRPVACVAWSSAPLHLGSRDRLIGWSRQERLANIALLACNTRFLIRPWVMVPHLASHILGRMARLLSADWQRLYAHPTTSWRPSSIQGALWAPATRRPTGSARGRPRGAPRTTCTTWPIDRSSRCWAIHWRRTSASACATLAHEAPCNRQRDAGNSSTRCWR